MRGKVVTIALALVAAILIAAGCATLLADRQTAESYRTVAAELGPSRAEEPVVEDGAETAQTETRHGDGTRPNGADWAGLSATNPSVAAWLTVKGTTVDVPVVQASAEDPDSWLYRDLWGASSDAGVPYIDHRCSASAERIVAYGHRTVYESYLFHDLSPLYGQESFDACGPAVWDTPDEGPVTFIPLCAASIDMRAEGWQASDLVEGPSLEVWLEWACSQASALSQDHEALVDSARRVLLLVTCNGRSFYPDTRTVIVYVSTELPTEGTDQ